MSALECPAGTVPGWLDESGNATLCVGDLPLVELPFERIPSEVPIPSLPLAPLEGGELIPPVDVYPTPLPLDPLPTAPEVLAATGPFLAHPEIVGFIGFALLCLGLALFAAVRFAQSRPTRYHRTPERQEGVASTPEVSAAPFPNLLAQK